MSPAMIARGFVPVGSMAIFAKPVREREEEAKVKKRQALIVHRGR